MSNRAKHNVGMGGANHSPGGSNEPSNLANVYIYIYIYNIYFFDPLK